MKSGVTVYGVLRVLGARVRQAGINSRMRMGVQGRFMQVRFIEIHQVFAKKGLYTFLTVVCMLIPRGGIGLS